MNLQQHKNLIYLVYDPAKVVYLSTTMSPPPKKKAKSLCKPRQHTSTPSLPSFRGFVHVDPTLPSRENTHNARRELSNVYTSHLVLDAVQATTITALYAQNKHFSQKFDPINEEDQVIAGSILAASRLDVDARECLENKWSVRWLQRSGSEKKEICRVLYQW
jgi:hypothetical protein